MPTVHIMSVIGSAVPAALRASGVLACWYLVREGEPITGPLISLKAAEHQLKATTYQLEA
ncbi:hypothetical protein PSH61_09785 [Pseudomonas rhodesiae]|uniref:hypothetical protein n=1 Tax=Pseudomonas rhodesiae TaxID=76760 RepID=UPI002733AC2A|nr:hypothetical protein [Pseudomonas rhodesiae]WLI31374.1 hypothetical protein PSH61_09785 [Pseudomonas rhodesiae]